ncbi:MAG: insulinase family protein [Clostridia bacterium]|nr:insulinase family protein [Clostridia bacterium]
MQNVYREILPGVRLRVISTDKFKTSCFSASFMLPLTFESATMNALIPSVLKRGTKRYPDMTRLTSALDSLYGARVEPLVRKYGNVQASGVVCDLINSKCVTDGEKMLEETLHLALEVLLDPVISGDAFIKEYVESEKENLVDYLNGAINEKLSYAYGKSVEALFEGTGFGVNEDGDVTKISEVTHKSLYEHYKKVYLHAPLEIFFCGDASFEEIEACIKPALLNLPREYDNFIVLDKPAEPKENEICTQFDVLQANLLIGLYTPCRAGSTNQPAVQVLTTILGGGTASKLFTHVREEKSLCYYVGAKYDKYLQTIFMYSGVDPQKVEEARGEMLKQLIDCQEGKITDEELQNAKRYIIDGFKTNGDSAVGLEAYWLSESVMGLSREVDFRIARIMAVDIEAVVDAANSLKNCMTYVLTGKETPYARKGLPQNS